MAKRLYIILFPLIAIFFANCIRKNVVEVYYQPSASTTWFSTRSVTFNTVSTGKSTPQAIKNAIRTKAWENMQFVAIMPSLGQLHFKALCFTTPHFLFSAESVADSYCLHTLSRGPPAML